MCSRSTSFTHPADGPCWTPDDCCKPVHEYVQNKRLNSQLLKNTRWQKFAKQKTLLDLLALDSDLSHSARIRLVEKTNRIQVLFGKHEHFVKSVADMANICGKRAKELVAATSNKLRKNELKHLPWSRNLMITDRLNYSARSTSLWQTWCGLSISKC